MGSANWYSHFCQIMASEFHFQLCLFDLIISFIFSFSQFKTYIFINISQRFVFLSILLRIINASSTFIMHCFAYTAMSYTLMSYMGKWSGRIFILWNIRTIVVYHWNNTLSHHSKGNMEKLQFLLQVMTFYFKESAIMYIFQKMHP